MNRAVIRRVSRLLTYEATADLETQEIELETRFAKPRGVP
jgi:uracil phosphoribosyltransferase